MPKLNKKISSRNYQHVRVHTMQVGCFTVLVFLTHFLFLLTDLFVVCGYCTAADLTVS